jgi:hypothetical protein
MANTILKAVLTEASDGCLEFKAVHEGTEGTIKVQLPSPFRIGAEAVIEIGEPKPISTPDQDSGQTEGEENVSESTPSETPSPSEKSES